MAANGMTISEAAHRWVSEMNSYPQDMIHTLIEAKPDDWTEVTKPGSGDRVCVWDGEHDGCYGEIVKDCCDGENDLHCIEFDDKELGDAILSEDEFEVERDGYLPMWGWMWSFGDSADDYWLEGMDGIRKMSQCGFRIYENEEWGYFFGIDGAGYSFYEPHWIPLYEERGLQWHDPKAEQEFQMTMKGYKKGKIGELEWWFDGDRPVEEALK